MKTIYISSGEGELGMYEEYTGKRTVRAIKARLTRERCGGDRWARVSVGPAGAESAGELEDSSPEDAVGTDDPGDLWRELWASLVAGEAFRKSQKEAK